MKRYCIAFLLLLAIGTANAQDDSSYAVVRHPETGQPISSRHPVYDSRDRLAVEVTYLYGDDGVVAERSLQSFDKHQYKLRKECYTADDELIFVEEYRWGRFKEGRPRRVRKFLTIQYDADGTATKSAYRYCYFNHKRYIFLNGKLIYRPTKPTDKQP
ncbi:MAG: hypothetical protein MJZ51_04195 [Bacteroidales bacterium]|nr:hypothetical protein [Bacteroidales bacterium]